MRSWFKWKSNHLSPSFDVSSLIIRGRVFKSTSADQSRFYSACTHAKKSNHDDNPRSWIEFKVDIVIPVVENTTQKYHQRFHKRVSDKVLYPRGRHLGKIGYGDVPLVRVPFSGSENLWQGLKITKFQKIYLTGSTFCQFLHFLGLTLKNFSDFVPDRVQISPDNSSIRVWILSKISIWQGPFFRLQRYVPVGHQGIWACFIVSNVLRL